MKLQLAENQTLCFSDDDTHERIFVLRFQFPGKYIVMIAGPGGSPEIQGTIQTKRDFESITGIDLTDYWEDAQ